jgi:hypothetical protein
MHGDAGKLAARSVPLVVGARLETGRPGRRWWDEGSNVYHDNGATGTRAFDFAEPPRVLSVSNRYSR